MHIVEKLESFIIDSGLASQEELAKAKAEAEKKGVPVGSILVSRGVLTADDLRRLEAYTFGMPFVDLKNQKLDFSVLSLIPEPIARNHNIIAFKKGPGTLEVAMLDTKDLGAINFVRQKMGLKILPRLTDDESMKWALLSYQKALKAEFGDLIQREAGLLKSPHDPESPSIIRIMDTLLRHAIIQGASDIHIEPTDTNTLVRYRMGGLLRDAMLLPKHLAGGLTTRIKKLANLNLSDARVREDGRFRIDTEGENVAFRVSTMPVSLGEKTVMRLLREGASGFTLEGLGFHDEAVEELHQLLATRSGLIIVSGPKSSGKTTTLYTLLDILNSPSLNISTIEDPVEYQMPRVNQCHVRPEIGFTFAHGLRILARQDPDVIMVGDIDDRETASLAAHTAHTALMGPLVLAGITADSATEAIEYLKKLNIGSDLLDSSLKAVIGQKLVKDDQGRHRGLFEFIKMPKYTSL